MVKALSSSKNRSAREDEQRKNKKQAKKEAKLVAQVEQAKKTVRKAQNKLAKMQSELQEHQTRLSELETTLSQLRRAEQAVSDAHAHPINSTQDTQTGTPTADADAHKSATDVQPSSVDLQTSSSLPVEGRDDLSTQTAASASQAGTGSTTDSTETQPASPPPVEGRSDIDESAAANTSSGSGSVNTPIENIPTEQPSAGAGAQVHADISINPPADDENLNITSGGGTMPIVTHDEHAWPPPQIREEVAEAAVEETHQQHAQAPVNNEQQQPAQPAASENKQPADQVAEDQMTISSGDGTMPIVSHDEHAWPPPQIREEVAEAALEEAHQQHAQMPVNNKQQKSTTSRHSPVNAADEEKLAISSGDGTMPIVSHDEHAWPPPQIREEVAEAVIEEVQHEHAQGEAGAEEAEHADAEHEEGTQRPRRTTRRRSRSQSPQD